MDLAVLEQVQRRGLWLATSIVRAANARFQIIERVGDSWISLGYIS